MSIKSQTANMKALAALLSQELGYISGSRESGPNGAKKEFLDKASVFLRALGKDLCLREMDVHRNPAGIAVSGEVYLYGMWSESNGINIVIEQMCDGYCILYRTIKAINDHRGGGNHFIGVRSFSHMDYPSLLAIFLNFRRESADRNAEVLYGKAG